MEGCVRTPEHKGKCKTKNIQKYADATLNSHIGKDGKYVECPGEEDESDNDHEDFLCMKEYVGQKLLKKYHFFIFDSVFQIPCKPPEATTNPIHVARSTGKGGCMGAPHRSLHEKGGGRGSIIC